MFIVVCTGVLALWLLCCLIDGLRELPMAVLLLIVLLPIAAIRAVTRFVRRGRRSRS